MFGDRVQGPPRPHFHAMWRRSRTQDSNTAEHRCEHTFIVAGARVPGDGEKWWGRDALLPIHEVTSKWIFGARVYIRVHLLHPPSTILQPPPSTIDIEGESYERVKVVSERGMKK